MQILDCVVKRKLVLLFESLCMVTVCSVIKGKSMIMFLVVYLNPFLLPLIRLMDIYMFVCNCFACARIVVIS